MRLVAWVKTREKFIAPLVLVTAALLWVVAVVWHLLAAGLPLWSAEAVAAGAAKLKEGNTPLDKERLTLLKTSVARYENQSGFAYMLAVAPPAGGEEGEVAAEEEGEVADRDVAAVLKGDGFVAGDGPYGTNGTDGVGGRRGGGGMSRA